MKTPGIHHSPQSPLRAVRHERGSAIVAVLGVVALLSLLLVSLLQSVRLERSSAASASASLQARLSAESGIAAACALLAFCAHDRPAFLVGLHDSGTEGNASVLVLGATNLTNPVQLLPLVSGDPGSITSYPKLPPGHLENMLKKLSSTNSAEIVDLNDPSLENNGRETGTDATIRTGGMVASSGRYPALWQTLHDSEGKTIGRYAFVMTDESARLNPSLHRGNPRTSPTDWDSGPGDIPLTNASGSLFTPEEAKGLRDNTTALPTEGSMERAFGDSSRYFMNRGLLTRDPCLMPELIPPGYPEGGRLKYNLNDLATNTRWGNTPYARATNIAAIIDRNLPLFKSRDPSLSSKQATLYLTRLACNVVDYISPEVAPTGPSPDEPLGRDLVPYVTQVAERTLRSAFSSNSTTIESRYYLEVWNPTTSEIPAGGVAGILITNRPLVTFGRGLCTPFRSYQKTSAPLPAIRPNEFLTIAFAPEEQTWTRPDAETNGPSWGHGPDGNENGAPLGFLFSWNGKPVDMTRRAGISPGDAAGGLGHLGNTLKNTNVQWQFMTIPTWTSEGDKSNKAQETDEAINPGNYRFLGDPHATFLTAYKWPVGTNYPDKTLWNGISPAGSLGRGFMMDPMNTWMRRDRVPVDPVKGNPPLSTTLPPDRIASSYATSDNQAPFVIRKGPMISIAELGNIIDPAQVDDSLEAPSAGSPKQTVFCSGGGRTLRIGQPEFHAASPKYDWDLPRKRAVDLIDLFTVSGPGRPADPGDKVANALAQKGLAGRINVNTAPHSVLTALFTGLAVTSDRRFTNSTLSAASVEKLAAMLENQRPFSRLSDLRLLTTDLVNAESYTPPLGRNVPGSSPPVADVFDRAREEAFGKVIGHCVLQTRTFRLHVIGESVTTKGKTSSRTLLECLIRLIPDDSGNLIPSIHDLHWH